MPCIAAGGLKEYAEFVKEGNFSPMSVLNPELGIETEIFARDGGRMARLSGRRGGDYVNNADSNNISIEEVHANVSEILSKIEETTKSSTEAYKAVYHDPFEKRYKGRRRKISVDDDISKLYGMEQDNQDLVTTNSDSGYHSQGEIKETSNGESSMNDPNLYLDDNLLDLMTEEKPKFNSSFNSGEAAIKVFLDRANPYNKLAHPALPNVMKEHKEIHLRIGDS